MQKNNYLKNIALSLVTCGLLIACGSSNKEPVNSDEKPSITTGKVIDGYLKKATVCLDLDFSKTCVEGTEPFTKTNDNGEYNLTIDPKYKIHKNFKNVPILVYGGIDKDTGLSFKGKLEAPNSGNTIYVTPLTTLVSKIVQKNNNTEKSIEELIKNAEKKVKKILKMNSNTDLNTDPIISQKNGDVSLSKASFSLQKSIEMITNAQNSKNENVLEIADTILDIFVDAVEDFDETETGLNTILEKVESSNKLSKKAKKSIVAVKKVTKKIEYAFDNIENSSSENTMVQINALIKNDIEKFEQTIKTENDSYNFDDFKIIELDEDSVELKDDYDWRTEDIKQSLTDLNIPFTAAFISYLKAKEFSSIDIYNEDKIKELIIEDKHKIVLTKILKKIKMIDESRIEDEEKNQKEFDQKQKDEDKKNISKFLAFEEGTYISFDNQFHDNTYYSDSLEITSDALTFQYRYLDMKEKIWKEKQNNTDLEFNGQTWQSENLVDKFVRNADNTLTIDNKATVSLLSNESLKDDFMFIDNIKVNFRDNANKKIIKYVSSKDIYRLWQPVKNYISQNTFKTLNELKETWSGNNNILFLNSDKTKAIAFDSEQKLSEYKTTRNEYGWYNLGDKTNTELTIEDKELASGVTVHIFKGYDISDYDNFNKIYSVHNGELYEGELEVKGSEFYDNLYNETAMEDITNAILNYKEPQKDIIEAFSTYFDVNINNNDLNSVILKDNKIIIEANSNDIIKDTESSIKRKFDIPKRYIGTGLIIKDNSEKITISSRMYNIESSVNINIKNDNINIYIWSDKENKEILNKEIIGSFSEKSLNIVISTYDKGIRVRVKNNDDIDEEIMIDMSEYYDNEGKFVLNDIKIRARIKDQANKTSKTMINELSTINVDLTTVSDNVTYLEQDEIKSLFSNKKIIGTSLIYNSDFTITYKNDNTYSGTIANGKKDVSGYWQIIDNEKCQNDRCSKYYKDGDKYYTVRDGIVTSSFVSKDIESETPDTQNNGTNITLADLQNKTLYDVYYDDENNINKWVSQKHVFDDTLMTKYKVGGDTSTAKYSITDKGYAKIVWNDSDKIDYFKLIDKNDNYFEIKWSDNISNLEGTEEDNKYFYFSEEDANTKVEMENAKLVNNDTSLEFTKDYLMSNTLYNAYHETEDGKNEWLISQFEFTESKMIGFELNKQDEKHEGDYSILDNGVIKSIWIVKGKKETQYIKMTEKNDNYITVIWTDDINSLNNSSKSNYEYFYFTEESAKEKTRIENEKLENNK